MDILKFIRHQWDRVGAWLLVAAGALALVLGWVGVTSTPYAFEQNAYIISGGLGGLFLLGVAAMLWISADLRDEWRILYEIAELERRRLGAEAELHQLPATQTAYGEEAASGTENGSTVKARPLTARSS